MKILSAVLATTSLMMITGTQAWIPRNLTVVDTISLTAGLVNGIVHENHLDYMIQCVNVSENMIADVEGMVKHFSWPTIENILLGMNDIKNLVFVDMPPAVVNCV